MSKVEQTFQAEIYISTFHLTWLQFEQVLIQNFPQFFSSHEFLLLMVEVE